MKSPFYFFFFTDLDKGFFALDFWVLTTDFLDAFFFDAAADAFFFDDEVEVPHLMIHIRVNPVPTNACK
jgi:hypothetical protein